MTSLLVSLAISCALCLLLTPMASMLATGIGLVDRPDGRRKIHARAIPLAGGIAILASFAVGLGLGLLDADLRVTLTGQGFRLVGLFVSALAICLVGVIDDFGYLRGRHKLLGQILTALLLTQFGWVVQSIRFFDWQIDLGILAVPFTILWLLAAINSLNLLDGIDGLLASVGLVMCVALACMGFLEGQLAMACIAAALAGALAGYLPHNSPPASVFLGDAGSMLIGLIVGALALEAGSHEFGAVRLLIPICLLTIPLFDTAAAILRRTLTGRSIYTTDRAHLHHCLARLGLGAWLVPLAVSAFCLVSALGAFTALSLQRDGIALVTSVAVVGVLIASGMFGHVEFCLVRNLMKEFLLSLLRIPAQGGARQVGVRLQGTVKWEELWVTLLSGAKHLNLMMIRLNVDAPRLHEGYHATWETAQGNGDRNTGWRAEIPLMIADQMFGRLEVVGRQDREPVREKLDTLLTLVGYFEAEAADLVGERWLPTTARPAEVVHGPASKSDEEVTSKT